MSAVHVERPRDLDWPRASALLYGDWGTSKAYVIGLAFLAAGFGSFPIILAVCALTALVGLNYMIVCRCFPDGGGVYSAARAQSRLLAVVGALLLVADLTVTAALSGWAALSYLGVPKHLIAPATAGCILLVGAVNFFGPRHSGSLAVMLALPTVLVVLTIIGFAIPHLTFSQMQSVHETPEHFWVSFVGIILALSGVEAVANLTGTMKPDPDSPPGNPRVGRNAFKAILPVALEVCLGTAFLGWAMLSMPHSLAADLRAHSEDMLRFVGEHYVTEALGGMIGGIFGWIVGIVFALLLLSAVNTAVAALVGLLFMVARDGEMPRIFTRLNRHGVPIAPLAIAIGLPIAILLLTDNFESLAGLYAIGVVGAISVNLSSSTFNQHLDLRWFERGLMAFTAAILIAVEFTLARTKPDALFFVTCLLTVGLALRAWAQRHSGLKTVTVSAEVASLIESGAVSAARGQSADAPRMLVGLRGVTPALKFAVEEARLRGAMLYVLYVREEAVIYTERPQRKPRWQDDEEASKVFNAALEMTKQAEVAMVPIYATTHAAAPLVVDTACTLGVDFVILGLTRRHRVTRWLKGSVVREVAEDLPDSIQLLIYG